MSPNVESDDILQSLLYFFMPWHWRKGNYPEKLEEEFRVRFGVSHAYVFESGRSALYALLKHIGLCNGDEVILQAFTCVAVPNAVLWAGAKPVYADIDPQTLNMAPEEFEKKITLRTRAVIVQHTFGFPADMRKILALARSHNIFVIEDCAHALGASYEDKLLGTFGDAAFFSFGRDKALSSVFGGIAITNNKKLGEQMSAFQKSLPKANLCWTAKQIIHPALTAFIRSMHCRCAGRIGRIFLRLALGLRIITKAVMPQERKGGKPRWILRKMPNALARLAYFQLRKLERFNAHRRKIASRYRELLMRIPAQPQNSGAIYLRYVILLPDKERVFLKTKKRDIFLGDWYGHGVAPSGVDYSAIQYDPEECPEAERAAREALNLPTDVHIGEKEIKRIIKTLESV